LLLDVHAQTDHEAVALAGEQYRAVRDEAGLPESVPVFGMLYPPWPGEQRPAERGHHALLQRARDLLAQGDIVHRGTSVTNADAPASVAVVEAMVQHIEFVPLRGN
jgi:hypothetical protein